jgi:glucose/mannose-6-phosphate isomerase
MREAIKNFNKQFEYEPIIENAGQLKRYKKIIVAGMGGSHLAADLLKSWNPSLDITVHSDYGLPLIPKEFFNDTLIICSSYSGNTEEILDVFNEAVGSGLPIAVIATGGNLLDLAIKMAIPYVQMPATGIQPRSALGFSIIAMMKVIGLDEALDEIRELIDLDAGDYEDAGKDLAKKIKGRIPVIYSSGVNLPIAYNWKIKLNETGKIPAFCNTLPELNHNEMNGFDSKGETNELSKNFHFIFIRDESDNPKIIKRMDALEKLYRERMLSVEVLRLRGGTRFYKIFSSLVLADWTSLYTAEQYGVEAEQVPMVEEFKMLIK